MVSKAAEVEGEVKSRAREEPDLQVVEGVWLFFSCGEQGKSGP